MDKTIENGLLNVRKTARLLDVHPNTLRNWANQGRLPCYTVNSRGDRRFRLEDIEDFLERNRAEVRPAKPVVEPDKFTEPERKITAGRIPSGYLDAFAAQRASA